MWGRASSVRTAAVDSPLYLARLFRPWSRLTPSDVGPSVDRSDSSRSDRGFFEQCPFVEPSPIADVEYSSIEACIGRRFGRGRGIRSRALLSSVTDATIGGSDDQLPKRLDTESSAA